jgi:hypothetical protein
MIEVARNVRGNPEHNFPPAVRNMERRAEIVPHDDIVKERLFYHATETDCKYGDTKLLSKLSGIFIPCSHRYSPRSQVGNRVILAFLMENVKEWNSARLSCHENSSKSGLLLPWQL